MDCQTCAHWTHLHDGAGLGAFGSCAGVLHSPYTFFTETHLAQIAYTAGGEAPRFTTRQDFGCALHRAKEARDG